jgi:hypothetical protein
MNVDDLSAPRTVQPGVDHPMVGIVLLVGASVFVTVAAIFFSGLKFANAADFFLRFGGLLSALLLLNIYQLVRVPGNRRFIMFVNMMIIYLIMSIAMMTFQYCMATFKAYPITDLIENSDALIGFNWLKFVTTMDSLPRLSDFIGFCYHSWMREFIVVFIILSYFGKFEELYIFATNYIITGMGTLAVSGIIDAKSLDAVASYSLKGVHYPSGVSPIYLHKLEHLRQGVDSIMDFHIIIGLVSFPSFHAGAAVLLATATQNLKWLWLPFLGFNVLILVGTITEGGHNFCDVIAGCLFAIAGIAVARAFRRSGIAARVVNAASRAFPWSAVAIAEAARPA